MSNRPEPGRRSIRLRSFDYAGNALYFVTLCTAGRQCLIGEIDDGLMSLNEIGALVEREWVRSAMIRAEVDLHSFVVMPNHLHALVTMTPVERVVVAGEVGDEEKGARHAPLRTVRPLPPGEVGVGLEGARHAPLRTVPRSLGSFVAGFKGATTREFRVMTGEQSSLWQRGFYEHVVRDERYFERINDYIANNPAHWALDQEYVHQLTNHPS